MKNRTLRALLRCVGFLAAIFALELPSATAQGQQAPTKRLHLHLEPTYSTVEFTLKDTLHTVHGSFDLGSGDIFFDPHTGEAQGKIEIDTGTGRSGNDSRDGKMKKEFLEVTKFPVATFEPQMVSSQNPASGQSQAGFDEKAQSQVITVDGTFKLHGSNHNFAMRFTVLHDGAQITATTHFLIPYVAWGIKDPSNLVIHVENVVAIDVVAKGSLTSE
jgi:polyisoprenoid-binding protein YceI